MGTTIITPESGASSFQEIRERVLEEALGLFPKAFSRETADQEKFRSAFSQLLSEDNLKRVLFPKAPLHGATREIVAEFARKIKKGDVSEEELQDKGVVAFSLPVGPKESLYLLASLYMLPAPEKKAIADTAHPEEYKETRPHIDDSRRCSLPEEIPGTFAFYSATRAFGLGASMVVAVTREENGVQFHLQPLCTTEEKVEEKEEKVEWKTDNVIRFDGMKVYYPIHLREKGVSREMTLALSSMVALWGGIAGVAMNVVSEENKRTSYAYGGATEVVAVIKRKPD